MNLLVLNEPSDNAYVSVTHKGQANFDIASVPLFSGTVFTMGWLHGSISGDMAPINAARTGFTESKDLELWQEAVMRLHDEVEEIVAQRSRAAAEKRDQAVIDQFMEHLKKVFTATELSSVTTVCGDGQDLGWDETRSEEAGGSQNGKGPGRRVDKKARRGGPGRLPTVPYGGFGEFAPSIRVWRERNAFQINVKHADYVAALKNPRRRRDYIREICMHEAYIYSIDGKRRKHMEDFSDQFMRYWTMAFIKS